MHTWYSLTLVGKDQHGIVAKVTAALYEGGCNLGEASMIRLGDCFTIMLMVSHTGDAASLDALVKPAIETFALHHHIDVVEGHKHEQVVPDVRISVHGADRAGIVAQVTSTLTDAGLNILSLQSDVGGDPDKPIYVMQIEGEASRGVDALQTALDIMVKEGIRVSLALVDTLYG